jgi:hypothetical protein
MTTMTTGEPQNPELKELLRNFRIILDERLKHEAESIKASTRRLVYAALAMGLLAVGVGGAVGFYAVSSSLPGMTSSSLRTQELVLMGPDGRERGSWSVDNEGTSRLVMTDPAGMDRLKLTLRANGEQGVSMADSTGSPRIVLGFLDDGSGTLAFANERGQTRSVLGLAPNEESSLVFADPNGGTRAIMGVASDGTPMFWMPSVTVDGDAGAN